MENMRFLLEPYSPQDAIYFGCKFKPFTKQGYMSGGAGQWSVRSRTASWQGQIPWPYAEDTNGHLVFIYLFISPTGGPIKRRSRTEDAGMKKTLACDVFVRFSKKNKEVFSSLISFRCYVYA